MSNVKINQYSHSYPVYMMSRLERERERERQITEKEMEKLFNEYHIKNSNIF